jgi:hypothetical protein
MYGTKAELRTTECVHEADRIGKIRFVGSRTDAMKHRELLIEVIKNFAVLHVKGNE